MRRIGKGEEFERMRVDEEARAAIAAAGMQCKATNMSDVGSIAVVCATFGRYDGGVD